ncbi:uncharacterized protein KNAG_0B05460 [Huiozyma naganishii CBS 8797]|uniref:Uncharacterized protein n=1 Tax=Huiozyma naganishii (strain ATCC MYA-139 / BCRC 22969 / CBS 8797 / KCTC 17520 / NBRC 10181 / NCYC 3082 / Yp74L-3) TaxID=1071383 RepID=J7S400_HUIN7|nr:hypothetical protein KNAG_0B05460 [Kazachstania naganishii CBS 8797]CCK68979.1 hypothetical protein KNAG_0B05460 [Kazachstania naganishii CBS 8797]
MTSTYFFKNLTKATNFVTATFETVFQQNKSAAAKFDIDQYVPPDNCTICNGEISWCSCDLLMKINNNEVEADDAVMGYLKEMEMVRYIRRRNGQKLKLYITKGTPFILASGGVMRKWDERRMRTNSTVTRPSEPSKPSQSFWSQFGPTRTNSGLTSETTVKDTSTAKEPPTVTAPGSVSDSTCTTYPVSSTVPTPVSDPVYTTRKPASVTVRSPVSDPVYTTHSSCIHAATAQPPIESVALRNRTATFPQMVGGTGVSVCSADTGGDGAETVAEERSRWKAAGARRWKKVKEAVQRENHKFKSLAKHIKIGSWEGKKQKANNFDSKVENKTKHVFSRMFKRKAKIGEASPA